jgi:hypothetical protein
MGERGYGGPAGFLVREKHPDSGEVCRLITRRKIPPVDDSGDLPFLYQDIPGMKVSVYPCPFDIDGRLNAFIP